MNNSFMSLVMWFANDFHSWLRHLADHLTPDQKSLFTVTHALFYTVYPKKYGHGFCFAVLCCGYTLTDFPISIRLTSLALWQSNDCPSASKATLMNMDKYFMWINYERLHNHNKAKHNKTVCIFLGIYCISTPKQNSSTWCSMYLPQLCSLIGDPPISGCLKYTQHADNYAQGLDIYYWNPF